MAEPPILTLSDISLGFGGRPLFADVSLTLSAHDRLCLVGRNGTGKSTLMKIIAGMIQPDSGTRFVQPGKSVAYLPQDPDFAGHGTLLDHATEGLDATEHWRAESALDGLEVTGSIAPCDASGGERRRAALARLIAHAPDLMLLDEPTNHLDIRAIEWLEGHLSTTRAGFVIISHDRAFLNRLSRATLWLDRGEMRRLNQGFSDFEGWRDKVWAEEDAARHKLDRLIRDEARWAVEGISARRTRNQGRVRRLADLRAERQEQIVRRGPAAMALEAGGPSGKRVIEANSLNKSYGDRTIVEDFSIRIGRGERVALVGPNGAGKTTLLRMLIGEAAPDSGAVKIGANVDISIFDQNREALLPERSLWETLTEDKLTRVRGAADQVMVRGRPRHVVSYLKDFLFDERQARGPVSALSGGEQARLLLARLMTREANLLVLDEPTNDLDVETLDLLQELISDFDGTVLLVSHDRDFIDRVATTTIAMEGDGRAVIYAGGWSDYRAQRAGSIAEDAAPRDAPKKVRTKPSTREPAQSAGLSFAQSHRLEALPGEIDKLTAEISKLEALLAEPELYARDPERFGKASSALSERQNRLAAAEDEWLELEMQRETSSS